MPLDIYGEAASGASKMCHADDDEGDVFCVSVSSATPWSRHSNQRDAAKPTEPALLGICSAAGHVENDLPFVYS